MDATQMICDSILESDEERHEEENDDRGDPLGKLCILKNEHIPEKECFLYLGDNVLGRDPNTCSLLLLSPSMSKQHATISLSLYRRKGRKDEVEALLWDLGSMNGTRKGRLKLTPNVRYALSEGDSLMVADIPCKYVKCTGEAGIRTCVNNNESTKVPDALRENSGNSNTGKTKSADSGVTQGTPARTSGLTFEQTPTQQQHGSLVPDSESDSDEEKSRAGDRRRKAIVSDSDSYKSSPRCSTFMSPPNKVVPESEDESPITPSSSYKNRTRPVNFNPEESDVDIHRQERKKAAALEIVDDSEEETGNDEAATTANNSSAQPELAKMESNACPEANIVSQFNLDSDTDVEEEEAKLTIAAPPVLSNNAPKFHMDSDTDVEDDETDKPLILSDGIPKDSQVIPVVQPKGISMDSDTDVEEEGEKLTIAAPSVTSNNVISNNAQASNGPEFNMDSDTDVEDEDVPSAATAEPIGQQTANSTVASEPVNPNGFNLDSDTDVEEGETDLNSHVAHADNGETHSRVDAKPIVSKPAAPSSLHFDSDTDDEGILGAAVSKPPLEDEKPDLEILSNSDTDVEDDSPEIQPSISKAKVVEPQTDCDAASDVSKSICGQGDGDNPAAVTVDSDTDAEEAEVEDKGDNEKPVLQREITPVIQGASQQMCSTPIQQSEGNVEEMETQVFLSPSLSSYRCAVAARKPGTFSSGLDCQDEDFAVAETQSFILSDRGHDGPPEENPNISSDLESSVNEKDVSHTDGGHFQLELSDSSVLRAQALAMESTQAFVNMNLEETQPYADAIISDAREGPVDIALQATQAYSPQPSSDEEEENDDQTTGKVDRSVAQSSLERAEDLEEATQPVDFMSEAPTQPMCFDQDSDSEDSAPVFRKSKAKQIEEQETQPLTSVSMAETLPMEMMEDGTSNEEEETQPNSDLAEAQTLSMEMMEDTASEENSPVLKERKAKQLEEEATQAVEIPLDEDSDEEDFVHFRRSKVKRLEPVEDTQPSQELTVAPTQPLPGSETDESAGEDSAEVVGKRQTRKKKTSADSELSVAPTQPVVLSEDVASDEEEEVIPTPRKRKARKLEDTQSLTNSQEDAKEGQSRDEESDVSERPRRGGARSVKEKQGTEEEVSAGRQKRQTRGKSKAAPGSKGRRGRSKVEQEDESETEETKTNSKDVEEGQQVKQQEKEMAAKRLKEEEERKREQKEKEEMERLEKERIEKERDELAAKEEKERREREEKERREKEEKERLERERIEEEKKQLEAKEQREKEEKEKREREAKERREKAEKERLEKERIQKEKKELADKRKKEKEEKKQKEIAEKREREEEELKQREERERLEVAKKAEEELQRQEQERKDQEQKARLETEERLEKEKQEELNKTQEEAPRRGRRAARRTTAAPDSSATAVDDGGPAKRTRSRSNSSNSVGSEMSVSSISSQTSRGRGRGRGGAQKTGEVQAEKTPARGRRRTVATAEGSAQSITGTLSRSNSNTSLNSEVSGSSVSAQGRGRGGKQRGRGRRTESEAVNNPVSSQKVPPRGRKSARICSQNDKEDEADKTEPSVSTRGQGGAKDGSTKCTPEKDEKDTIKEEASTSRRGGRKRPAETDAKNESETKTQEENDVDSSITRKAGARNTPARKSRKAEVPEDDATPCEKPKGRGRASAVQRKKSEEQGDNSSMEQEANPKEQEPPQTPRSSVSRKRHSVDSESDPLPKTPRSSSASPSTMGRSRTPGRSYKVLFTGVVDETGEKMLCRLGGSLAKDVADMNCLVTDKVRRTVKFLCAVAKGIPIVTPQWLEKSGNAGTLLAPSGYLVKDREQENKFNFNLHESLRVASDQPLLQGYEIHVTKSVKPEPVHMKDIITSSGAVFLPTMPSSSKPKTVVISCEEDWSLCAPALSSSVPVVCAEFILTGILQQKVDLETHKLSGPAFAPGGRGRGRKKS